MTADLTKEHGDISRANGTEGNAFYDQYMDNHIGLLVDDIAPYLDRLETAGAKYFTRGPGPGGEQAVFFEIPGGVMFQLADKAPDKSTIGLTAWDICQNTSHGVLPPTRTAAAS